MKWFSPSFFFSPLPVICFWAQMHDRKGKLQAVTLSLSHTDTAHLPLLWQPGWCGPFRLFSRCRLLGRSPSDDGVICCLKIVPLWHIWCSHLGSLFSWISLCLLINLPWFARHGSRGEPQAPTWVWFCGRVDDGTNERSPAWVRRLRWCEGETAAVRKQRGLLARFALRVFSFFFTPSASPCPRCIPETETVQDSSYQDPMTRVISGGETASLRGRLSPSPLGPHHSQNPRGLGP